MTDTYDVVIAGGAAMGSSTAYHLASQPGFSGRILVVEKDLTYAKAASALSLSSVRQQFSSPVNIRVGLYGVEFLRRAAELLAVDGEAPDLPLRENGYLYLATEAGAPTLRENHAAQTREGADIVLFEPDEVARRFPFVNVEGVALAAWGRRGEGWFDGYALTQAYRRKARSLGVVYREDEVVAVERQGARVTGVTLKSGARVACGAFVNAAGASGAAKLARELGVDIPVRSRKRCVFVFEAKQRFDNSPLIVDTSGVYMRPEGSVYLAGVSPPEADDPDSDDFDVVWSEFDDVIWPALAHRIPAFEAIKATRAWAGHYDLNIFDHNAIVGRLPGADNAYLAAGFSGHGMQQSPAVGRGLAELIALGRYASLDLADFAFERIAANRPLLERNVI
ncbi:MAG: FAD-binding oxidoreductase [Hyphomicrobiales bacterium]|nr:FAD-binding oxidoreductase [Hyphomicrobiales bacterium]